MSSTNKLIVWVIGQRETRGFGGESGLPQLGAQVKG